MTLQHAAIAYAIYWVILVIYAFSRDAWRTFALHARMNALLVGAFIMILPFYWMVVTSFKDASEALEYPPTWWPRTFLPGNYPEAWNSNEVGFGQYFIVSIVCSIVTTIGTIITSILAAYAFARMNFFGKGIFFVIVLATLMVPSEVLLIPKYIIISNLGWLDTYKALIIPFLASVFSIFMMRQFFMTIPMDLWDAAQIDGAGRWRFLWQVVIPVSRPVLITSGIFAFVGTWNALLWPLIVTTAPNMRTIMVGLQVFNSESGTDFHLLMAASTFCILPLVILFFFLQRFFIEGIARSGLKS
jgi:multiple sugar transport system permease protein